MNGELVKKIADAVIERRNDLFLDWCKGNGIGQYSPYRFLWWLEECEPALYEGLMVEFGVEKEKEEEW